MLSWEYLLEEAKDQGLPATKKRAILREYIQTLILNSIYKTRAGKRLYFMGGTSLRVCYRLPRFSEDLDFNAKRLSLKNFQNITENAVKDLSFEGFKTEVKYSEGKGLYTTYVNFPEVMQQYNITDARGIDLMVKLEVNQPSWPLKTQQQVLSLYGFNYMATVMAESSLVTEKLCAMLARDRGRDIYDLMFMLRKKFPFDNKILKANRLLGKPKKLITHHLQKLGKKELRRLALQVKPFLFKEDDMNLVLRAPEYAKKFLEEYIE